MPSDTYIAGYVAVSLLKKYRKPSKHPQLQLKWSLSVRVLNGVKLAGEPYSPLDRSKLWLKLIGQESHYHTDDKVCRDNWGKPE